MLFLLIACAAGVYLWHHAPALFLLLAAGGLLWYVVIPLCIIVVCSVALALVWGFVGLSWLANALPDWRIFRQPEPDGLLSSITYQGWVAISMAGFVVFTTMAFALLPR